MHAARSLGGDQDAAMDRYAFMLDALRQDGCRRLQAYPSTGAGKFTTWLLIVARRLCLDHHRQRYGRRQTEDDASRERQRERRNLTDLVGGELVLQRLEAPVASSPDEMLRWSQLRAVLEQALAALDPADRLLLRLRFEEDLSMPEVARTLGADSPFRFYRRLEKLLEGLRAAMEASGVTDAQP